MNKSKKINKQSSLFSKIQKNNIIKILILIFFIFCCSVLIIIINSNKNVQQQVSTYLDTKQLLEDNGFVFESQTIYNDNFTFFTNDIITVSAYIKTDTDKFLIEYRDKNIGSKTCGITDTSVNTTEDTQKQFNSYINWKKDIGLNDEQIKEVLIKYYLENTNK